jgi:hypothetical protein
VGARDKVRRVGVSRMNFIYLCLLADSQESTTSDPTFEKALSKALNIRSLQDL